MISVYIFIIVVFQIYIALGEDNDVGAKSNIHDPKHHRIRCGGLHHASMARPCSHNDTICGHWESKWWLPHACTYQDITSEEARQCMGNRTIACIGDSQIRDLCVRIAYFLMGVNATRHELAFEKFDYTEMDRIGTIIEDYPFWENNVPPHNHNGYVMPEKSYAAKNNWTFQVQIWSLFRKLYVDDQAVDILKNKMVNEKNNVRPAGNILLFLCQSPLGDQSIEF